MRQAFAPLIGVLLGFALATMKEAWQRRRRRRSHWAALRAELEFCRRQAEIFLRDRVAAPLYRLPTAAYSRALPGLLSEAAVPEQDLDAMMRFFTEVETLNRGLDLAQAARARDDQRATQEEFQRNAVKAELLVPPQDEATNCYTLARQAIERHL